MVYLKNDDYKYRTKSSEKICLSSLKRFLGNVILQSMFFCQMGSRNLSLLFQRQKKTDKRGPPKGVTNVPSLNFKTLHFMCKRGCYVTVSISLMYFSAVVTVSTHLCVVFHHFCCPTSLFQGHVACRNFLTPRGPHNKISKMSQPFMQLPLVSKMPPFLQPLLKTPKQMHV